MERNAETVRFRSRIPLPVDHTFPPVLFRISLPRVEGKRVL